MNSPSMLIQQGFLLFLIISIGDACIIGVCCLLTGLSLLLKPLFVQLTYVFSGFKTFQLIPIDSF